MRAITKMRIRAGLTQAEVANRITIERSTVAKWETGETLPRAERLLQLARLYDCTVDELLTEEEEDAT